MLTVAHRFHGLGSLQFAYKQGRVVRGEHFSLRYASNQRRSTYRVAVVVSKKVAKSAVVRNRIRRKIFEAMRLSAIPADCRQDVIINVYSSAVATQSTAALQTQLHAQLRAASII